MISLRNEMLIIGIGLSAIRWILLRILGLCTLCKMLRNIPPDDGSYMLPSTDRSWCRSCRKKWFYSWAYGMTLSRFVDHEMQNT